MTEINGKAIKITLGGREIECSGSWSLDWQKNVSDKLCPYCLSILEASGLVIEKGKGKPRKPRAINTKEG